MVNNFLISQIRNAIKANGNNEITADTLQTILINIVNDVYSELTTLSDSTIPTKIKNTISQNLGSNSNLTISQRVITESLNALEQSLSGISSVGTAPQFSRIEENVVTVTSCFPPGSPFGDLPIAFIKNGYNFLKEETSSFFAHYGEAGGKYYYYVPNPTYEFEGTRDEISAEQYAEMKLSKFQDLNGNVYGKIFECENDSYLYTSYGLIKLGGLPKVALTGKYKDLDNRCFFEIENLPHLYEIEGMNFMQTRDVDYLNSLPIHAMKSEAFGVSFWCYDRSTGKYCFPTPDLFDEDAEYQHVKLCRLVRPDGGPKAGRSLGGPLLVSKNDFSYEGPEYADSYEYGGLYVVHQIEDTDKYKIVGLDGMVGIARITYSVLKSLVAEGQLIAGKQYRIIDFVTTCNSAGSVRDVTTSSAKHPFDIIVTAASATTLLAEAHVCPHKNDTYFANSKLSEWTVKYDINNDISKYKWADETNGKGVIYYMRDEFGNECPYDFKNILFNGYYTFDLNKTDYSLNGSNCFENKIKGYYAGMQLILNNIVFKNTGETDMYQNTFGVNCYSNSFGGTCRRNSLDDNCYGNSFGGACFNNTLKKNCSANTIGDTCGSNTFGAECAGNVIPAYTRYSTLGNACSYNTIRATTTSSARLQYLCVKGGVAGTSSQKNTITIDNAWLNSSFEITVARNSSGTVKIYNEADLA